MDVCYPSTTDWGCAPESYVDALDDVLQRRCEALAWTSLKTLLGGRLAICPTVVRPCALRCAGGSYFEAPVVGGRAGGPYIGRDGLWRNACGCSSSVGCGCSSMSEVRLQGPVGRVTSVLVDGTALDPSAYRVDGGDRLVRIDGGVWPACQDMAASPDSPGTFAVEYFIGEAPDIMADWAAGVLAYEFSRACKNDNKCRLPRGVTSVVRQGISMEIRQGIFTDGSTGIQELDAYIFALNPHGLRQRPTVMSPDTLARQGRMQTWGYDS